MSKQIFLILGTCSFCDIFHLNYHWLWVLVQIGRVKVEDSDIKVKASYPNVSVNQKEICFNNENQIWSKSYKKSIWCTYLPTVRTKSSIISIPQICQVILDKNILEVIFLMCFFFPFQTFKNYLLAQVKFSGCSKK